MAFPIISILAGTSTQLEQLGTKAKFWYELGDEQRILFKEGRPGTGENWAEKVCCEIARLLDIPHAEYELALWGEKKGVVTPSLVPKFGRLVLGNELLAWVDKTYDPSVRYKSAQHVLRRVIAVLQQSSIGMPVGWNKPAQITNATGVFAGYLLLDALVGNQDRHHENWGLIIIPNIGLVIAPTFDHASSLGRNETDKSRIERLNTKDKGYSIESYVAKARSGFYENQASIKAMGTLEAFHECSKVKPRDGQYWLDRLFALNDSDFWDILKEIPDDFITPEARKFALEMLSMNRKRLLSLNNT